MAEEEHHHGLGHGHEAHKEEHKDKDKAIYWGLGLGAAGLVMAVLIFANGGSKKQGTNTVVQPSEPFIPNPTDVSIGSNAAPLFWPALPTSGTPSKPKTHHHGDKDDSNKKKKDDHDHTTPNDHKKYGKSPTGASHGHTVTSHGHNPVVTTKGKQNG